MTRYRALLLTVLLSCAHEPDKGSWRDCREQCEEHRGPTWSWFGGPTVPPGKYRDCMDSCRVRKVGMTNSRKFEGT
jgi:hypothetical protein